MIDLYRAITLSLTIIALIVWVIWLVRHPTKWGYAVWIIIWLINIMAFYASILFIDSNNPEFYNSWSIVIRWQALISVIGAAILFRNGRKHHDTEIDYA
jgi:hypothetical protein